jgi:hypothetical protein
MDPVSTDLPWAPSMVRVGRAKLEFAFHKCSAPSWHAARAVQYRHARSGRPRKAVPPAIMLPSFE